MIDEMASVYHEETRKARKDHKCIECGGIIRKGETYSFVSAIFSDGPASFKTCSVCAELRVEVDAEVSDPYDRTAFGQLQESVFESHEPEWIKRYVDNRIQRFSQPPDWMIERVRELSVNP